MKRLQNTTNLYRRKHRISRVVLIAAVLAMILSVTVYAVYSYSLRDLKAGEWTQTEAGTVWESGDISLLSLVGYQNSPEYKAGDEWEAYIHEKYEAGEMNLEENPDYPIAWRNLGASNAEMAAKLKEIAGHYGLTLPESRKNMADAASLYADVGTGAFLPAEPEDGDYIRGGVVYNTGSIRSMNSAAALEGGGTLLYQFYSAAKGTFSRSDYLLAELESFEEWEYVTAGGTAVLLAVSANKSLLVANLDHCFIFVNILSGTENTDSEKTSYGAQPVDKGDLEAFADGFDFIVLNTLAG